MSIVVGGRDRQRICRSLQTRNTPSRCGPPKVPSWGPPRRPFANPQRPIALARPQRPSGRGRVRFVSDHADESWPTQTRTQSLVFSGLIPRLRPPPADRRDRGTELSRRRSGVRVRCVRSRPFGRLRGPHRGQTGFARSDAPRTADPRFQTVSAWTQGSGWAVQDSNLRPPACKAGALPAELTARRPRMVAPAAGILARAAPID